MVKSVMKPKQNNESVWFAIAKQHRQRTVFNNPYRSHINPVYQKVMKVLQTFKQADETVKFSTLIDKLVTM